MTTDSLMQVTYEDPKRAIRLTAYADTIIYRGETRKKGKGKIGKEETYIRLYGIRFGGYPEIVRGLADAINGGGSIIIETETETIYAESLCKQYRRVLSHDGIYAEAALIADDDPELATDGDEEDENQIKTPDSKEKTPPRTNYIFCPPGDTEALFQAVDEKTAIPMIPEFQDYVLSELQRKKILCPLQVKSLSQPMEGWTLQRTQEDKNIADVLESGLQAGVIQIPGTAPGPSALDQVKSVTEYLNTFGVTVAERIKKLFVPLFDPATQPLSPEVLAINEYIKKTAGYSLYDAQLAVAEAIKRQLRRSKVGIIVAECGAGKSKIGATALAAFLASVSVGVRADQSRRGRKKSFNVLICPSHITGKWVREIQETLPDTFAVVVRTITQLDQAYALYERGDRSCYVIISKEMARDGYMRAPAVRWNKRRKAFVCPTCGCNIEVDSSRDGKPYYGLANQFDFLRENDKNHKCAECKAPLWTALNPSLRSDNTPWVKIGGYGFVYRAWAFQHLPYVSDPAIKSKIQAVVDHPDASFPARGARRAYPLSSYIKRHYRGRVDTLLVDELHQYSNDSGQGDAMGELFNVAKKVVGMTATLINGYSSGIFHLLYRMVPHLMKQDGKDFEHPSRFDAEYGVLQHVYEETTEYNSNRRTVRRQKATRQLPGVSPLVYTRFLLENAAFLSLSDMGKDLPEYEEIPIPIQMPSQVAKEYNRIEKELKNILKGDKKVARKILSAYMNLLTAYPDQPYGHKPIYHPISLTPIVVPAETTTFEDLLPKEKEAMEIVQRKVSLGERVLLFTNWTRLDTQKKLYKLISEAGYHADILPAKVPTSKREEWVAARVRAGVQVLIVNPSLLETGLDLNDFTTLIFYDVAYKLFTLRQASRRSWRINQTAPRVEVYLLYYAHTMQHKAMKLMASKLAVAGIIEGNFTDEGLAAMSECEDMTTLMAKELMLGIKDNVEDVSTAFKRMAFLKPSAPPPGPSFVFGAKEPQKAAPAEPAALVQFTFGAPVPSVSTISAKVPSRPSQTLFNPFQAALAPVPGKHRRSKAMDENQITLFELVGKPA